MNKRYQQQLSYNQFTDNDYWVVKNNQKIMVRKQQEL